MLGSCSYFFLAQNEGTQGRSPHVKPRTMKPTGSRSLPRLWSQSRRAVQSPGRVRDTTSSTSSTASKRLPARPPRSRPTSPDRPHRKGGRCWLLPRGRAPPRRHAAIPQRSPHPSPCPAEGRLHKAGRAESGPGRLGRGGGRAPGGRGRRIDQPAVHKKGCTTEAAAICIRLCESWLKLGQAAGCLAVGEGHLPDRDKAASLGGSSVWWNPSCGVSRRSREASGIEGKESFLRPGYCLGAGATGQGGALPFKPPWG